MSAKLSAMLAPALALAERRFAVLALWPRTKLPLTEHGLDDATTDAATITQWWTETPDANIGLACAVSGFVVIDIDRHGAADGFETLAALKDELGPLPETVEAVTGGGGSHLIFLVPTGAEFRGGLGPGVDIRHRAYIVVAPSIHPDTGRQYRWIRSPVDQMPAPLPDAWLARMLKPTAPKVATPSPGTTTTSGCTPYGRSATEAEIETVRTASVGTRNTTLNTASLKLGSLHAGGEIEDRRDDLVVAAMYAGLPECEARATVESGWRAGLKKPRTAPPRYEKPQKPQRPQPQPQRGESTAPLREEKPQRPQQGKQQETKTPSNRGRSHLRRSTPGRTPGNPANHRGPDYPVPSPAHPRHPARLGVGRLFRGWRTRGQYVQGARAELAATAYFPYPAATMFAWTASSTESGGLPLVITPSKKVPLAL